MLFKTKGIVLSNLKYGESSLIVNIYTEQFGAQSYIENGVRKAKAKHKIAIFQPLTMLDLVVYKKQGASLNRLSEAKCVRPYSEIPYHIVKSTIAIFLSEVLSILLRSEEDANKGLFDFLENALTGFDEAKEGYHNFHLKLLIHLTQYLGFYPANAQEIVEELRPYHTSRLSFEQISLLDKLMDQDHFFEILTMTGEDRQLFLKMILQFYQIHSHSLKEIKSLKVLHEVLH